jgi:hypothetical protein
MHIGVNWNVIICERRRLVLQASGRKNAGLRGRDEHGYDSAGCLESDIIEHANWHTGSDGKQKSLTRRRAQPAAPGLRKLTGSP